MTGRIALALRSKIAIGVTSALFLIAPAVFAGSDAPLSGSIAGYVRDARGIPQMGATVFLFNRSERLIQQAITNERGLFGFAALAPDLYSVRVSLASFVPAVKQKIAVQPGMQSLLYVDMASVLSSIQLVYATPGQGALMSEDWKWTLKASASTRPVLRMLPPEYSASDPTRRDSVFSDTRGLLSLSGGDPGSLGGSSTQSDLGTAFAVATSMYGHNQLKVSGNVGYNTGATTPTAGVRTSYSRDGVGPEVAVTVQQIYFPMRAGMGMLSSQGDGTPALRTMSVSTHDSYALTDNVRLDYGASMDSVSFLDHSNYMSKFARLSYDRDALGTFQLAYSSGAPPVPLMSGQGQESVSAAETEALAQDLNALAMLPRVSMLDGHIAVQRTQDFEFGYEKRFASTTVNLTGYRENVMNAAMTMVAPDGAFPFGDVLPDISSRSSILDAGSYERSGFATSVAQSLGDRVQVGASFGSGGALSASPQLPAGTAAELRSQLQSTQRFWTSARASAKLPLTGTQITGSYQWMDYNNTIMPDHFYLTQDLYLGAGLNVLVRQPIPSLFGFPGRLEATAELRNGLAQGYLPIVEGGQHVTLVESPRALRGGLSFIF